MRYTSIVLAALSASLTVAAPWGPYTQNGPDTKITIELSNQATETGSQTSFLEADLPASSAPVASTGPFKTINILLGKDVQNKDLRCKAFGIDDKELVATRGANTDISFADGGNGPWTFKQPSVVSRLECSPEFKKGDASASAPPTPAAPVSAESSAASGAEFQVQLSDNAVEFATQTTFIEGGEKKLDPTGGSGPYTSVTLRLNDKIRQQDLRCKILDLAGNAITVQRGENIDTTFADGGQQVPWQFLEPAKSEVSKIICDPTFKKASA